MKEINDNKEVIFRYGFTSLIYFWGLAGLFSLIFLLGLDEEGTRRLIAIIMFFIFLGGAFSIRKNDGLYLYGKNIEYVRFLSKTHIAYDDLEKIVVCTKWGFNSASKSSVSMRKKPHIVFITKDQRRIEIKEETNGKQIDKLANALQMNILFEK